MPKLLAFSSGFTALHVHTFASLSPQYSYRKILAIPLQLITLWSSCRPSEKPPFHPKSPLYRLPVFHARRSSCFLAMASATHTGEGEREREASFDVPAAAAASTYGHYEGDARDLVISLPSLLLRAHFRRKNPVCAVLLYTLLPLFNLQNVFQQVSGSPPSWRKIPAPDKEGR